MTEFFEEAIKNNNHDYIEKGLNHQWQPVPANSANAALQTGLMIACQHKSLETVKVFLKKSTPAKNEDPSYCNVNLADASGWTALHYAAQCGSWECVKLLIEHKAEIDATINKNETALFLATKHNHPVIVEFLAENNCHLQAKALYKKKPEKYSWILQKEEFTALEFAVLYNFVEIAKCLLFHLIRTNQLNEEQLNNVLCIAARDDHTKIAHELVINGANVNYNGGSIENFFFCLLHLPTLFFSFQCNS
jgi:ankyrin repeat protein